MNLWLVKNEANIVLHNNNFQINFAEEHFGQVCTTQQIEASIRTHDCINAIDSRTMAVCQKFSRGETLPGKG